MNWFDKLKQAIRPRDKTRNQLVPTGPQPELPQPDPDEKTQASVVPENRSVSSLSPREKEVFYYLLEGMKMKDIACKLHIKTSTVNGYCTQIYKLLGVNSKARLILQYSEYRKKPGRRGDEKA